jgi:hypothetical protein
MAAPTPSTYSRNVGHGIFVSWNAVWANTDNLTDSAIIDLSAQAYTSGLTIQRVLWMATAGIEFTLEFDDDSSDEFILSSALAPTDQQDVDFTWNGLDGVVYTGSGGTGDLVLITTSAASADEINLFVWARCN